MLTLLAKLQAWKALREEHGATLVEYALLVVLIAIAAILAVTFVGEQVSGTFEEIGKELS